MIVSGREDVQAILKTGKEVAVNLDQNPDVIPHFSGPLGELPVILASISTMWGIRAERPMTGKETVGISKFCFCFAFVCAVHLHLPLV